MFSLAYRKQNVAVVPENVRVTASKSVIKVDFVWHVT